MSTVEKRILPEIFVEPMIFYWMWRRGLNRLGPQSCVSHHPAHLKGTGHRGRWSGKQNSSINRWLLAIFFLLPIKKFLPISFKIQVLETSPKTEGKKQLDVSFF
jgi:hypothetical protein